MKTKITILFLLILLTQSCKNDLEIIDDLSEDSYSLLNQDSVQTNFPDLIKNKIGIVGYIFTNCPDICPLTTNNMRLIRERIENENIKNVEFVSISFDPEVDKPNVLKKFSELHGVDFDNWQFLTGEKSVIDNLIKEVGVVAFVGDSTTFNDGTKTYYYVHTDRIQLIDQEGRIRMNYLGSKIIIDQIMNDVKLLTE
ncbi:MAG: SCO family protein [Ignavibacteriales bacterium]|nr:SCO family protein [Ignavibacteriales bacterium]